LGQPHVLDGDVRFELRLDAQQKADLVAFLGAL
jgi:hypothetical protein